MVRIYCLTRIKAIPRTDNYDNNAGEVPTTDLLAYPEDNTNSTLVKLKNDPQIFRGYQLTEISIGYYGDGTEKMFLMLIYQPDTGLMVFRMIPGSVSFQSISNEMFELNVATSQLFSKIVDFDLNFRIRNIKNTQVRGLISDEEIEYYEDLLDKLKDAYKEKQALSTSTTTYLNFMDLQEAAFDDLKFELPNQSNASVLRTKLSDISKLIKLLCDKKTGTIENVPESARYNQKVKCLWIASKSNETKQTLKNKNDISRNRSTSIATMVDALLFLDSVRETSIETSPSPSNSTRKRGRPMIYEREELRKRAHIDASRKYNIKKESMIEQLKTDAISLEEKNQELSRTLKNLFSKESINISADKKQEIISELDTKKEMFEAAIKGIPEKSHDSNHSTNKSGQKHQMDKNREAVQRCRERKKMETEIATKKYEFYQNQNQELEKHIQALFQIKEYMRDKMPENQHAQNGDNGNAESGDYDDIITSEPSSSSIPTNATKHEDQMEGVNGNSEPDNREANSTVPQNPEISSQFDNPMREICKCFFENLPITTENLNFSGRSIYFLSMTISRLKNLKTLNLSNNKELELIPWDFLPSNLRKLNLNKTNISDIPGSMMNLQSLTVLEIQNANLWKIPSEFENLSALQYLNLSYNKFKFGAQNLAEVLWNRLPRNIVFLKLCGNNLHKIPCSLKKLTKLKNLAVNECHLEMICPYFLNQSRSQRMTIEIARNWKLEALPIIPQKIYQPILTTGEKPGDFSNFNLITDNESFISTSRFPSEEKKPIYEFKVIKNGDEKICCECCAECGKRKFAFLVEQLMVMDFNLCLSTEFNAPKVEVFDENNLDESMEISREKYEKEIFREVDLVYAPGKWKAKVITWICPGCLEKLKLKIEEAYEIYEKRKEIVGEKKPLPSAMEH